MFVVDSLNYRSFYVCPYVIEGNHCDWLKTLRSVCEEGSDGKTVNHLLVEGENQRRNNASHAKRRNAVKSLKLLGKKLYG